MSSQPPHLTPTQPDTVSQIQCRTCRFHMILPSLRSLCYRSRHPCFANQIFLALFFENQRRGALQNVVAKLVNCLTSTFKSQWESDMKMLGLKQSCTVMNISVSCFHNIQHMIYYTMYFDLLNSPETKLSHFSPAIHETLIILYTNSSPL